MEYTCCIYLIESISNVDKCYVGSSKHFEKRKKDHLKLLKGGRHHSIILQNHHSKYGTDDLVFKILEICKLEELINREQFYINKLTPYFNVLKVADRRTGIIVSDATRLKITQSLIGRVHSQETRDKMSLSHKGNKSNKCKKLTEFHKLNISKGNSGRVFLKGRKASDETKLKISLANKGRVFSDSHKINLSNAISGVKHSEERKKINSNAQLGKKLSTEHKAKISLGLKNSGFIISDETRRKQQETFKQTILKRKLLNYASTIN